MAFGWPVCESGPRGAIFRGSPFLRVSNPLAFFGSFGASFPDSRSLLALDSL